MCVTKLRTWFVGCLGETIRLPPAAIGGATVSPMSSTGTPLSHVENVPSPAGITGTPFCQIESVLVMS